MSLLDGLLGYGLLKQILVAGSGVTITDLGSTAKQLQLSASGGGGSGSYPTTTTSASYTQPSVGSAVSITVVTTEWMAAGLPIFVSGTGGRGGYYVVSSVTDATHVVARLGQIMGEAGTVASGATVIACGPIGATGAAGADGVDGETGPAGPVQNFSAVICVDGTVGSDATGVRGGLPFKTIGAAFAAAQTGDVVRVGPGTYTAALVWPTVVNLTLEGSGIDKTTIVWTTTGDDPVPAIALEATNGDALQMTIRDLTVQCDTAGFNGCISVSGHTFLEMVRLERVRCLSDANSVVLLCSAQAVLDGCEFQGGGTIGEIDDLILRDCRSAETLLIEFRAASTLPVSLDRRRARLYGCTFEMLQVRDAMNVDLYGCAVDTIDDQDLSATYDSVTYYGAVLDHSEDWATNRGWRAIHTARFASQAPSSTTITLNDDERDKLVIGSAVRVWDQTGVEVQDAQNVLSGYSGITGLGPHLLGSNGRIWFKVTYSSGTCQVLIYRRSAMGTADLIGQTATYTTTGSKAVTAANGSGLSGTITVDLIYAEQVTVIARYYQYGVVTACTDSLLTLKGVTLSTTAGRIQGLWSGGSEKVVMMPLPSLAGSFCSSASSTAIATTAKTNARWFGPPAYVVEMDAQALTVASTYAKVNALLGSQAFCTANSGDGLELATTSHYVTTTDIDQRNRIERGTDLEIKVTAGSSSNADMTMSLVAVLE